MKIWGGLRRWFMRT